MALTNEFGDLVGELGIVSDSRLRDCIWLVHEALCEAMKQFCIKHKCEATHIDMPVWLEMALTGAVMAQGLLRDPKHFRKVCATYLGLEVCWDAKTFILSRKDSTCAT